MYTRMARYAFVVSGTLFGFGLAYGNAVSPEQVIDFLLWRDLGIVLILAVGTAGAWATYTFLPRMMQRPRYAPTFDRRTASLSASVLGGAVLFGIGWGLAGMCPGTALAGIGAGNVSLWWALAGIVIGVGAYEQVSARTGGCR